MTVCYNYHALSVLFPVIQRSKLLKDNTYACLDTSENNLLLQIKTYSFNVLLTGSLDLNFVSVSPLPSIQTKCYYCLSRSPGELVTSVLPLGSPPTPSLASFKATLFHLNFNPIYGLSLPSPAWGYQAIHPAYFMSPGSVIKASAGMCVLQTHVSLCCTFDCVWVWGWEVFTF